jgi:exonuclease III/ribonuclease HI
MNNNGILGANESSAEPKHPTFSVIDNVGTSVAFVDWGKLLTEHRFPVHQRIMNRRLEWDNENIASHVTQHPFPSLALDLAPLSLKQCTKDALQHLAPGDLDDAECAEVFLYSDGTGGNKERGPAFGFMVVKACARGVQHFGGYFAHKPSGIGDPWLGGGQNNQVPENESAAIIAACAWILQSRIPKGCKIVFLPDAMYVIGVAGATYQPRENRLQVRVLRALIDLVSVRCPIEYQHIKSHRSHPWNEMADCICEASSEGAIANSDKHPVWEPWIERVEKIVTASFVKHSNDAYPPVCEKTGTVPAYFSNGCLRKLPKEILAESIDQKIEDGTEIGSKKLAGQVRVVTYNVQSIGSDGTRTELETKMIGIGANVVGVQETRTKKSKPHVSDSGKFWVIPVPACKKKDAFGIECWISLSAPIGAQNDVGIKLNQRSATVLYCEDRMLFVCIQSPLGPMIVVVSHAPYASNRTMETAACRWWEHFEMMWARHVRDDVPVIWCGDANASFVQSTDHAIGSVGLRPSGSNSNSMGPRLEQFANFSKLKFPNSFPEAIPNGGNNGTFAVNGDRFNRIVIDHIGCKGMAFVPCSGGDHCAELCATKPDHFPSVIDLVWSASLKQNCARRRIAAYDRRKIVDPVRCECFRTLIRGLPLVPADVEPSSQTFIINNWTAAAAAAAFPISGRIPKQPFVTHEIVAMIKERNKYGRLRSWLLTNIRYASLRATFKVWANKWSWVHWSPCVGFAPLSLSVKAKGAHNKIKKHNERR